MLACARLGAIHTVVFAGFSAESLRERINDTQAKFIITANEATRDSKLIPLKTTVDTALQNTSTVNRCVIVRHTNTETTMRADRDIWYHELIQGQNTYCPPEPMHAEDPLFILYTSGSTGKPKGLVHTTGGYLVHVTSTHNYYFKQDDDDVFWCTADMGWITGHSYVVYGPLCNKQTTVICESMPLYPTPSRWWDIIDDIKVTHFYTAPTAIRALMKEGNQWLKSSNRDSLKVLGTVGEPINPEAWNWYFNHVGKQSCPVFDTWWQTETGGIMISGNANNKPGSAGKPFYGIKPVVLDNEGLVIESTEAEGYLCINLPWPGLARTIYGDHERYLETYFQRFRGYYLTGDGCRR